VDRAEIGVKAPLQVARADDVSLQEQEILQAERM